MDCEFNFRAEFTKEIVTPALGVSGVGGAMAVYGAFDAIVSMSGNEWLLIFKYFTIEITHWFYVCCVMTAFPIVVG